MKILIAGGAGCLGSNLIEHWLPLGHEIAVIDNFSTGHKELVDVDGISLFPGSVSDFDFLNSKIRDFKPEIIINAAASYKDPHDLFGDVNTNINGSINICKSAEQNSVERIINFQTALCYGRPQALPIDEKHPVSPFTSYGISKTAGEFYSLSSGVNCVSLRLANITGPRLSIGPIPTFYSRLKEKKACFCTESKRDFLDIDDFLNVMDLIINRNEITGIYNISTGVSHSIREIYNAVCQHFNIDSDGVEVRPVEPDDVLEVCLDATKAKKELGWSASVDFSEMIAKQLEWYDDFGVHTLYSHLKAK